MSDSPYTIMVINGSQEMLELFEELFRELGEGDFHCHTYSLEDVHHVDVIRRVEPSLVIIDQPFGDEDLRGWELIQHIRLARDLRDMPIIFTTTNVGLLHDLDAQLESVDVRAMLKPFDPDNMLDLVRTAMEEAGVAQAEEDEGDEDE